MDFNRGGQFRLNNSAATPAQGKAAAGASGDNESRSSGIKKKFKNSNGLLRCGYLTLLLSGTILFVAMIFFLVFGTPLGREAKYVQKDQYQAVFVNVNGTNGGQVYFGRITSLTTQYIRLTNVFYIQNQQSDAAKTSSAYNLVKLGCELHGPTDEMLINRDQVFFWENLKSDSQVAQKAAEFYKQNPNGQKCDTSNATTQSPATTGTNGTTTPTSTTTPTTNTTNPTTNKTTTGQ
jgi:hypothetical protein